MVQPVPTAHELPGLLANSSVQDGPRPSSSISQRSRAVPQYPPKLEHGNPQPQMRLPHVALGYPPLQVPPTSQGYQAWIDYYESCQQQGYFNRLAQSQGPYIYPYQVGSGYIYQQPMLPEIGRFQAPAAQPVPAWLHQPNSFPAGYQQLAPLNYQQSASEVYNPGQQQEYRTQPIPQAQPPRSIQNQQPQIYRQAHQVCNMPQLQLTQSNLQLASAPASRGRAGMEDWLKGLENADVPPPPPPPPPYSHP